MKYLGACVLPFLFSTAGSAATLHSAYLPPASSTGSDAPVIRQNRNRAPIQAPAPTNHYAVAQEKAWTPP